jgi:hypothetical protein
MISPNAHLIEEILEKYWYKELVASYEFALNSQRLHAVDNMLKMI